MWKWTNPNNIKMIILDGDSLKDEFLNYPYSENSIIVKVYRNNTSLSNDKLAIKYFDIRSLLNNILKEYKNIDSTSIVSISEDYLFLKEMMQHHIGTISTVTQKIDYLKYAPDFQDCNIDRIVSILEHKDKGYCAEVISYHGGAIPRMSLIKSKKELLINGDTKEFIIYFGGRYFPAMNSYILNDPLSCLIRKFKKAYIRQIDDFYDLAISFVSYKDNINLVTYVPLKPSQIKENSYDRFKQLQLKHCMSNDICLKKIILCTKDFVQKQNDANQRQENVKDAFEVIEDVKDKNILIIDDVFTTGSTITEIAKTLYEAGAKNVEAIVLAINQLTNAAIECKSLPCPVCGERMILKVNSNNGRLFFGCPNYDKHTMNTSIDFIDGIEHLRELNKLEIISIYDLDDMY